MRRGGEGGMRMRIGKREWGGRWRNDLGVGRGKEKEEWRERGGEGVAMERDMMQ